MTQSAVLDFDGTVTESDLLDRIALEFGDPAVYQEVEDGLDAGAMPLREVIVREFEPVTAPLDEVVAWVLDEAKVRAGFREFVNAVQAAGWDVHIVSSGFEELMRRSGIANDTTVVFYGDRNNWYATYAYWLFKYFGHQDVRVMNGGRAKWEAEGRPMTRDVPAYPEATYTAADSDESIRAYRDDVLQQVQSGAPALVDVRSPAEYTGEVLHMAGYPQEGAQRGGHVRGAKSIPWATAANEDGTFKSPEELKAIYEGKGITADKNVIAYCRIGERSSHTWFVLRELLGYPDVRNYDGSWTEWGSMVGVPIAKGAEPGL